MINETGELTEFLTSRHPGATLLLTGSFARGTQTEFSDYDILSIQTTGLEPYRKAYLYKTRLVEVFCHTEKSVLDWISKNATERKKSMASMICDSRKLIGDDEIISRLKEHSTVAISSGPPPFSSEEDWVERKNITEKRDDLCGMNSNNEVMILGTELFVTILNYLLVKSRCWLTNGKYYRYSLQELSTSDIKIFSNAIDTLVDKGESKYLIELVDSVLNRFGGKAYEYQE